MPSVEPTVGLNSWPPGQDIRDQESDAKPTEPPGAPPALLLIHCYELDYVKLPRTFQGFLPWWEGAQAFSRQCVRWGGLSP